MKWFRFYHDALDDPKVQRLPGDVFRKRMLAAIKGEQNEFSRHIAPGLEDRPQYPEWRRLRDVVFQRDEFTCQYCGAKDSALECDHVVPLARGGTNDTENLLAACRRCNRSKSIKLLHEWRR